MRLCKQGEKVLYCFYKIFVKIIRQMKEIAGFFASWLKQIFLIHRHISYHPIKTRVWQHITNQNICDVTSVCTYSYLNTAIDQWECAYYPKDFRFPWPYRGLCHEMATIWATFAIFGNFWFFCSTLKLFSWHLLAFEKKSSAKSNWVSLPQDWPIPIDLIHDGRHVGIAIIPVQISYTRLRGQTTQVREVKTNILVTQMICLT